MFDHPTHLLLHLSVRPLHLIYEVDLPSCNLRRHHSWDLLIHCGESPIGSSLASQTMFIADFLILRDYNSRVRPLY